MPVFKNVTDIKPYAFQSCAGLVDITIPDCVATVAGGAFYGCANLQRVVIGLGVEKIGVQAFANCASLNEVICKPTTPPVPDYNRYTQTWDAFKNVSQSLKIYVPDGTVDAYTQAWVNMVSPNLKDRIFVDPATVGN